MPIFGGEGLEDFRSLAESLSERRALNAQGVIELIERKRSEAAEEEGRNFVAPSADQLFAKLESTHTPFIAGIAWTGNTSAPGVIHVSVFLFNPDAERHFFVFLHAFVGPAHLTAEIGQALAQVDGRFPRITTPAFFGHILEPSQDVDFTFDVDVRAGVPPSNYIGNAFVFKADFFDDNVGDVLDRGVFIFEVTGT